MRGLIMQCFINNGGKPSKGSGDDPASALNNITEQWAGDDPCRAQGTGHGPQQLSQFIEIRFRNTTFF